MRSRAPAVVLLLGLASVVRAEGWVEPDPAAVVGRWTGTASWRQCALRGPARVTLDVVRDGGGYRVDLAPVLDGLGPELLAPVAARALEATREDLRVRWTTGKPNRATLRVGFSSGCTGTLTLTRASTGSPACDELTALRAIARTCGAAPALAAGAGRPPSACKREATALRAGLVDAGCLPAPVDPAQAGTRVPACVALVTTLDRLMRCGRVPVDMKQRLRVSMGQVDRWGAVDPDDADARARAAAACDETRDELTATMTVLGCP